MKRWSYQKVPCDRLQGDLMPFGAFLFLFMNQKQEGLNHFTLGKEEEYGRSQIRTGRD